MPDEDELEIDDGLEALVADELLVETLMGWDGDPGPKRFDVAVPEDWDRMTPEQQTAAAREMAREIQRQLGLAAWES